VRNGQPIAIRGNLLKILADGAQCQVAIPGAPVDIGPTVIFTWPLSGFAQPPECTKGPPTALRFEFGSQFGFLIAETVWSGSEISVDILVSSLDTLSPTPTPGTSQLPPTGGPAPPSGRYWLIVTMAAFALSAATILGMWTWQKCSDRLCEGDAPEGK
jgi:hypothetical protein